MKLFLLFVCLLFIVSNVLGTKLEVKLKKNHTTPNPRTKCVICGICPTGQSYVNGDCRDEW